jgi:hypothetical protein
MSAIPVLVLGGYGAFGSRLSRLLAAAPTLLVHVAGRRREAAERCVREIGERTAPAVLDRDDPAAVEAFLRAHRPRVVLDATGPFQGRDHRLPELVASHGAHWLDLADAREYVVGIGRLHEHARAHDVLVTSGASTLPALSVAVVDQLLDDLDALESISIGLSPGLRSPRGRATIRSILSYCGRPIPGVAGGKRVVRRGWGDLRRHRYPAPVGGRWLSNVDAPDLEILAQRYYGVDTLEVQAGLELSVLHLGLSFASALVARGWVRGLDGTAGIARHAAGWLQPFGSDAGAMHVTVRGAHAGRRVARHWALVGERGDGPFVPASVASGLAKRLCDVPGYAPLPARGAAPCVGLVQVEDVLRELAGRAVRVVQRDELLDSVPPPGAGR